MKILISFIALFGLSFGTSPAQTALPPWAEEMYHAEANAWEVDRLYRDWYRTHAFEKNYHTQYYKRWIRSVQGRIDKNGFVLPIDIAEVNRINTEYSLKSDDNNHPTMVNPFWSVVGPFMSIDGGGNPAHEQTNVYSFDQCLASPNVLYCGTEPGEVYKSVNTGISWQCVSLNETFGSGVGAVEVDPTDPNIVFAGSSTYIKRSISGGTTWNIVHNVANLNVNEILVNPSNTQIVLAACDGGLLRSTDGGVNWTTIFFQRCYDVKLKANDPNTVYLVKNNPALIICEFFISTDMGASWNVQSSGWYSSTDPNRTDGGARIGVTPADPNRVYVYLIGEAKLNDFGFIGVYRSNDGGINWTLPNGPNGGPYTAAHPNLAYGTPTWTYHQGFYDCAFMVSSTNANDLLIGGLNLWRSNNGASTFSSVAGYIGGPLNMHVDMQDFRAIGSAYWITCDGGMYYSSDFYTSQPQSVNGGIRGSDYWGFGSGWNEDVLVGGLYHNGNLAYHEGYGSGMFLSLGGGEAPTGYVNPGRNTKTYYSDIDGVYIPNALPGGASGFTFGIDPNESYWACESSELEFHPQCYNIAFTGRENKLWKTIDGGGSFTLVNTFGTNVNDIICYIEISRKDPNVMYLNQRPAASAAGRLWKTSDGGLTWVQLSIPVGNSRRMLLSISPVDPNILWIAYPSGANGNKIFKTSDGGATWTNITTSLLDNESVQSISHIGGTDGGVYYCTDRTVYYRNNTLPNWSLMNDSLPAYFNSNIARPFYRDGKIRIASYGKGIWEAPFFENPTGPIAQIMVDKLSQQVVCTLDSFYFEDHSILNHAGATWQWTFQGGSPATSTMRGPSVSFPGPGTYLAILTVTDSANLSDTDSLYVTINAFTPPVIINEGFQASFPPNGFTLTNAVGGGSWTSTAAAGGYGNSTQSAFFDNFNFDAGGAWSDMRLFLDMTNPPPTKLFFDVAYVQYDNAYSDTMEILVSTDCGQTFTSVYWKGGSILATAPPDLNFWVPAASEWRTDSVDMSAYSGDSLVMVVFRNWGWYGNNLFIDNINLGDFTSVEEQVQQVISVFPNPIVRNGTLNILNTESGSLKITMIDALGKEILKQSASGDFKLDLSPLSLKGGIYLLRVEGENEIRNFRIVIE